MIQLSDFENFFPILTWSVLCMDAAKKLPLWHQLLQKSVTRSIQLIFKTYKLHKNETFFPRNLNQIRAAAPIFLSETFQMILVSDFSRNLDTLLRNSFPQKTNILPHNNVLSFHWSEKRSTKRQCYVSTFSFATFQSNLMCENWKHFWKHIIVINFYLLE